MIHILYAYISEDHHQKLLNAFLPKFSIDFQKKVTDFRRWQDAQLSLLGRILLFHGIKKFNKDYTDDAIKYTEYDKPYFEDKSIKFNISHSAEVVTCVLSADFEIGIDIELLQPIQIEDFKSQMTAGEWHRVNASEDKTTAFFTYWTQKEAVIKAHGKGLLIPLKSFEVLDDKTSINTENFFLKEIKLNDNYKCYIASNTAIDTLPVEIKEFSAFKHLTT